MKTVALDTVLCVRDASVVVAKTTQILKNITFSTRSGNFLAVIGPSAMIRLPEHISHAEKMERVDEIINLLDLRKCINTVPAEINVVSKERAAGAYRLSVCYFAKTISELPLLFLMLTVFYTIVYWMAGLNGLEEFFMTWPILIMSVFSAQGLGLFLGAVIPDVKIAFLTGDTIILIALLFSGFITQTIPHWISWVKYLSHIHYPLSAISIIVFDNMEPLPCNSTSGKEFQKCVQNESAVITSKDILHEAGMVLPIYCYLATFALIFISL